jgi:alanine dehydrogenase
MLASSRKKDSSFIHRQFFPSTQSSALMQNTIAIRKETKDPTQRRAPLSPDHVRILIRDYNIAVLVEPCSYRIFRDEEYLEAGATITTDLTPANIIFGIKEIAPQYFADRHAYCFFSHTIKAQPYNMPMLKHICERDITLFDYELVTDHEGKRVVFFGNYAGYAGMIDSLWALGRRLDHERIATPFSSMKYASDYENLAAAETAIRTIGQKIHHEGLPEQLAPFICCFTGYGNVSKGAQSLYDLLPVESISPQDLHGFVASGNWSRKEVYKVVFHEQDMYRNRYEQGMFNLQEFFHHPERYEARMEEYLPYFSMLINGIYWDQRYARFFTKEFARTMFGGGRTPRLRVIGDISCDVEGSVELTVRQTHAEHPVYVYEPVSGEVLDGCAGHGPVILAVDQLPTELPREASIAFGNMLMPFVPELAALDYGLPLEQLDISDEFRKAVIAHRGELTPGFTFLNEHMA